MSPTQAAVTPTEIYDQALKYARDQHLVPEAPRPLPTKGWLPENVAVLERYHEWLTGGGASPNVIHTIYIPMAGHVLGLNRKPAAQLDLDADLQKAMDYIHAKGHGPDWTDVCRISLDKFRRFLRNERGQIDSKITPFEAVKYTQGLPEWLGSELERFQHLRQRNWRSMHLDQSIRRFWCGHLRMWRFWIEQRGVNELKDLRRQHLYDYIDFRLQSGRSASGINGDLRDLRSFLLYLQDQGCSVPQSLLRVPTLKQPDSLPRFLTDEQVRLLKQDRESRVAQAALPPQRRDALLDRAAFYLLWQSGLRCGEVEDLLLEDLDLPGQRLTVRRGKGMKDRTVFLSATTVLAVQAYLAVRGMGPTAHVFLYRNQPLCKDLIGGRLRAAGERVGVSVCPHKLRHTCATQLLNAGCPITSIQKFLGHRRLNSTMIYARVHDQTVAEDYYLAMARVEQRLDAPPVLAIANQPILEGERQELMAFVDQFAEPELSLEKRLGLVFLMRSLLFGKNLALEDGMKQFLT